ncbi:MAG: tetratricopeptide repeat protein [Woeseia sp.]
MSPASSGQRNRGVRASRAKLAHALTEAGLKTQAALAERIADIEGLDNAPKDVVNRVFRELPVDPTTLERVARALNVDAYTLYKTADRENLPAADGAREPESRKRIGLAVLSALTLLATVFGLRGWFDPQTGTQATGDERPAALGMGTPTLAVIPFLEDADNAFGNALRPLLEKDFNVARPTANMLTQSRDPAETATRLRTDVVVDGEFRQVGRLTAVRVYLFKGGVRQQVWADSVPAVALPESMAAIANETAVAIRRAVGLPVPDDARGHFPLAPVQDDYLEGELYLDAPSDELNVKRAQSRFEAALRRDANYARAHAGLCQSLLEEYWMDNEERALNDASLACGQAVQLDPDDLVVATAHAHFLQRTGRGADAVALYEQMIARHPKDSIALGGLASSQLEIYRETGNREHLLAAKANAKRAADVDPYVWKPLFFLATMEWFDGNVPGAVEASEAARKRDENEYVLANLGSFHLCDGNLEKALEAYEKAQALNPNSYVGDEFLGQAHYFLGDFRRSAELRQRAIDSVANGNPEIHEMWGNLADSYRQVGDTGKAIAAYVRAAEIAERDYLRGTVPVADQAARAYYYTMLAKLDASMVPRSVLSTIDDEIDSIADELVSASALRRMAQIYLERGEINKARGTLGRATESCKGYSKLPDLAPLQ